MSAKKKQVFKNHQAGLFMYSPGFEDLFEVGSVERTIYRFVDTLRMKDYEDKYAGGGTSAYHPSVMLKIILMAYANNIFGCRSIERFARHDMCCHYICNSLIPSYSSINRFRSRVLGASGVKNLFSQLLVTLTKEGHITFEECYTDGTTIEARSSRKRIVWQQSERRFGAANKKHIEDIVEQALAQQHQDERELDGGKTGEDTRVKEDEDTDSGKDNKSKDTDNKVSVTGNNDKTSEAGSKETKTDIRQEASGTRREKRGFDSHITPERIDEIQEMISSGRLKLSNSRLRELQEVIEKSKRHRNNDILCGDRSGTALTDPETVAMHPKDDTRRTGPCLPMYDLMVTTENQYFLHYGLYGRTSDISAFPLYLEELPRTFDGTKMVADAGFGSFENYLLAKQRNITPIFKYSLYDTESKPNYKQDPFDAGNMSVNPDGTLRCPGGKMVPLRTSTSSRNGVTSTRTTFRGESCPNCPFRTRCLRGHEEKKYRTCEVNLQWKEEIKPEIKELLDNNKELLKRRPKDVEPRFSHLRYDNRYKRLRHFGRSKCMMDIGIMLLAMNLKKYAAMASRALNGGGGGKVNTTLKNLMNDYICIIMNFWTRLKKLPIKNEKNWHPGKGLKMAW